MANYTLNDIAKNNLDQVDSDNYNALLAYINEVDVSLDIDYEDFDNYIYKGLFNTENEFYDDYADEFEGEKERDDFDVDKFRAYCELDLGYHTIWAQEPDYGYYVFHTFYK